MSSARLCGLVGIAFILCCVLFSIPIQVPEDPSPRLEEQAHDSHLQLGANDLTGSSKGFEDRIQAAARTAEGLPDLHCFGTTAPQPHSPTAPQPHSPTAPQCTSLQPHPCSSETPQPDMYCNPPPPNLQEQPPCQNNRRCCFHTFWMCLVLPLHVFS